LTFSVAVLEPLAEDLNTTLMVQVAPTASGLPHVLVCEKDPALAPLNVMLPMDNATPPMFVTVTNCGELLVFVCQVPNVNEAGCTV
jgi:hypothetical protein